LVANAATDLPQPVVSDHLHTQRGQFVAGFVNSLIVVNAHDSDPERYGPPQRLDDVAPGSSVTAPAFGDCLVLRCVVRVVARCQPDSGASEGFPEFGTDVDEVAVNLHFEAASERVVNKAGQSRVQCRLTADELHHANAQCRRFVDHSAPSKVVITP
jgi:hypothetical protein